MHEGILSRDNCPICNTVSSYSIFKRSFSEKLINEYMNIAYQGNADIEFLKDIKFEIVKCKKCNFSYQKYVLDENRLNDLYNKWIDPKLALKWNNNGDKIRKTQTNIYLLSCAKKYLKREPNTISVLDFGAGFGETLLSAKDLGYKSYAYEFSIERIKHLEENGINTIDDNNQMRFDFIIVNQVLEHITYPGEILKKIASKLNDNGLAYISVPNCHQIVYKLKNTKKITNAEELHKTLLKTSVAAFQHINFFTNYSFKKLLRRNGFRPIFPLYQSIMRPYSVKYFLRPFYKHFFGTGLFVKKI